MGDENWELSLTLFQKPEMMSSGDVFIGNFWISLSTSMVQLAQSYTDGDDGGG